MLKTETLKERIDSKLRFFGDFGNGQWFATAIIGKLYKRENSYQLCFAKDFCWKNLLVADS